MKDRCIGMKIKKSQSKDTKNEFRYFLESNSVGVNWLFELSYSYEDGNAKSCKAKKYYLPKGIIKNYSVIINGKNFYDQPIDSYIKRFEEIRKLATVQGQGYTQKVC